MKSVSTKLDLSAAEETEVTGAAFGCIYRQFNVVEIQHKCIDTACKNITAYIMLWAWCLKKNIYIYIYIYIYNCIFLYTNMKCWKNLGYYESKPPVVS